MKKYLNSFVFVIFDLLFLTLVYLLIGYFRTYSERYGLPTFSLYEIKDFSFLFLIILFVLFYEKIYTYRYDFWEETRIITKSLILSAFIILSLMTITKTGIEYSRIFILMYFFALLILFPIYKRIIKRVLYSFDFLKKRIRVVGNNEQKIRINKEFKENWYLGLLSTKVNHEAIFIASKNIKVKRLNKYLSRLLINSKEIYVIPYLREVNLSQANILEYFNIKTSVIHIENKLLKKNNIILKEVFEKILIVILLVPMLFIHFIIVFLIKKDSKGEALFKQNRFSKNSRIFKCYKYRTMYKDSDSILKEYLKNNKDEVEFYDKYHKYKNDPRITKVGKFLRNSSLDELPQLINVLKGDMSLIGPRPYMLNEKVKLDKNFSLILKVKPGISGLWQVSGRNNLSFKERIDLDIWYIQNWSLWDDLVILIKTIKVVLFKVGSR